MTARPFAGLTVLSMAEQYPGPYATMILSDLGADVVLVERPQGGDPAREFPSFFESLNRGKRSVVIDLKAPEGRQALLALAADADAVLEGFRPGTADKLGVGYEAIQAVKPDVVYVSISGFGQDGPYRLRLGHDVSYQALAGLLYERATLPDPGPPPSVLVADLSAGMFPALAMVTGRLRRERHGQGSYIDVAMSDGLVSWMTTHLHPLLNDLGAPDLPPEAAYGLFHTADGRVISLSIFHEDRFWKRLCELCGMPDIADLSGAERRANVGRLRARVTSGRRCSMTPTSRLPRCTTCMRWSATRTWLRGGSSVRFPPRGPNPRASTWLNRCASLGSSAARAATHRTSASTPNRSSDGVRLREPPQTSRRFERHNPRASERLRPVFNRWTPNCYTHPVMTPSMITPSMPAQSSSADYVRPSGVLGRRS